MNTTAIWVRGTAAPLYLCRPTQFLAPVKYCRCATCRLARQEG